MNNIKIFSGSASIELSKKVASNLDMKLGEISLQKFSDGEFQTIFKENIRGRVVFIIQSTPAPFDNYWELFQLIQAAKLSSASKIVIISPYMGYGRSDRKDKPRVSVGAKLIADFIGAAGATKFVTIDLHQDQIGSFFNIPVDQLYASYVFVPYLKKQNYDNVVVASADAGGVKKAKSLASHLNTDIAICYKQRSVANKVDDMILIGDVKDKNVIIVDDIIDTAGTICHAADLLVDKGAKSVRAIITHPVLSGNAYEKIENSKLTELIVTDTIPLKQNCEKIKVLSVSSLLSKAIINIANNKSLSKLFI